MTTKVYDADQVSMVFMNVPISSGLADGEFLTISQDEDDFLTVTGTDGDTTRSKSNNRNADIKVRLMQSSDGNAALSAINNLDKNAPNGAGIGSMFIRDRQGTSLYTAAHCWVKKPPEPTFDRKAKEREWTLHCSDLVRLDGGN